MQLTKLLPAGMMILIIGLFSSCYTQKKASEQVDKAHWKFPEMLAAKTRAWYPCITTDSSQKTEYKPAADSSAFYKSKADSLLLIKQRIKDSIAIRYKDSCRSVQDNYANGFNLGYEVGKYDGRQQCTPDTVYKYKTFYVEDSAKIRLAVGEVEKVRDDNKELARKIRVKNTWLKIFAGAAALFGIIIFFIIRSKRNAVPAERA